MYNWATQNKKDGSLLAASIIIVLSAGLRLFFLTHQWPETNSDEGTVGLMALHIAHFSDFPVYMYGQGGTLGSLEAYVGALLFPLFGQTVFALRVGVLLLFVVFLISMYLLTSLLYTRKLALLTLIVLSLGSGELLFRSYAALAGHAETPLFGALLILVANKLALSVPDPARAPVRVQRLLGYSCWGALVGGAFWNDPLTLPFILTSSLFLLIFCRHEFRAPIVISIVVGVLIGLFPVIIYNLTLSDISQSSFSAFSFLVNPDHPVASDTILARFAAAFLVTLPVSTGAVPFCAMNPYSAWPLGVQSSPQVIQCSAIHGAWALILVVLWLVGVSMAVRRLRTLWRWRTTADKERRDAVIEGARLMLLGSAPLTFLSFAASVQAITGPWAHHRYLIALAVATPAVFWPLWRMVSARSFRPGLKVVSIRWLCTAILAGYVTTMALGTIETTREFPRVEATYQSQEALLTTLRSQHLTRIYTDYWTCDLVAFLSQEQIICSVLDDQLHRGFNRYQPYVPVIAHSPHVAYVFPRQSAQNKHFVLQGGHLHYHMTSIGDYVLYQEE